MPPCVIFEDDHLLVVNKPAGLNTHAPSQFSGEGLYEWLRDREPRLASLAIVHRLDKETSGVMVFAKSPLANRSLTKQFEDREVQKKYILLTDRPVPAREFTVKTCLIRAGEKFMSRPIHAGGQIAETRFRLVGGSADPPACSPSAAASPSPGGEGRGEGEPINQPNVVHGPDALQTNAEAPHIGCWGEFELVREARGYTIVEAEPLTGRTHQIRSHAAHKGFPILGDILYGGTPASQVFLRAAEIAFAHPATRKRVIFRAPPPGFAVNARLALRGPFIESGMTGAYRIVNGASDGWPGLFVDRLGDFLLAQSEQPLTPEQRTELERLMKLFSLQGVYYKALKRNVRQSGPPHASPQLFLGASAPDRFVILENGLKFELSFSEGYSVGLFLDQRDNRRRLLTGHVAAGFELWNSSNPPLPPPLYLPPTSRSQDGAAASAIRSEEEEEEEEDSPVTSPTLLNAFSYTCGFSVCAAQGGALTTSIDLSAKYLEWGRRNFLLNGLNPADHEFLRGDVFDWMRRLAKKGRLFDIILLDPPTFSQSKVSGPFRVERDYPKLIALALPLLESGGVLFASSNAENWKPENFVHSIEGAVQAAKRTILQNHYAPQPPDFPISRAQPAYLKTLWLRIG